jgi:catechol 2,3-dioxygenase-like lactoylglutathione lyase family enzyme
MKIDHIALFCKDLEAMRQFFATSNLIQRCSVPLTGFFIDHFGAVSNEETSGSRTTGDGYNEGCN